MAWLLGFSTGQVPRYSREEVEARVLENLFRQRTLWTAVQDLLYSTADSPGSRDATLPVWAEVRTTCDPRSRSIELGVHFHVRDDISAQQVGAIQRGISIIHRVLPAEYRWRALSSNDGYLFASLAESGALLQVSKVERRIAFIDLPANFIDGLQTASDGMVSARPKSLIDGSFGAGPRYLLTRDIDRSELQSNRFCLPITGTIEADPRNQRVLFQEMQDLAPCVISTSIAPITGTRLNLHRRLAGFWSGYLDLFAERVANAGWGSFGRLRALYDKFLLPERQLFLSTTRVAALSEASAMAVAVHLVARLGGLSAFCVRPPGWHGPVPTTANRADQVAANRTILALLSDPTVDIPDVAWSDSKFGKRSSIVVDELATNGIDADVDPAVLRFFLEAPHLYSLDEIGQIAALPYADEVGLPGLESRHVPPFSVASITGVSGLLPANRLRIGLDSARGTKDMDPGSATVSTGAWHTIDVDDLTKHAFVVGSTGSGKTVTTLFLLRELIRLEVPALIIEPVKTEYFDQVGTLRLGDKRVRRVCFEGTPQGEMADNFLAFDPMRLQTGVSVARHASYLKSCFQAAFPMPPESVEAMLLESGIREYYTTASAAFGCGFSMFTRGRTGLTRRVLVSEIEAPIEGARDIAGNPRKRRFHRVGSAGAKDEAGETLVKWTRVVHPSLDGLRKFFSWNYLPRVVQSRGQGRLEELLETWRQFFERRFDALASGMIGRAAQKADKLFLEGVDDEASFSRLLEGVTVLELDGIPDDDQKALMIAFILVFLFERRQADDLIRREEVAAGRASSDDSSDQRKLRHVLVLEEAHRVLPNVRRDGTDPQGKSVAVFVDMLAEIRAFGQGIVIVEQIPTKVVPEAVKNTNLKVMLRLTSSDDREFLGNAMNFTPEQMRFVTSLQAQSGVGVDMVVFEQQLDHPRLLMLPLPAVPEIPIHRSLFSGAVTGTS